MLAGLLAAGLLLLSIAQFVRIPYPILLVLGGLGLSFVPGIPHIQLRPEVVLVAVLPPLLYGSAYFTSLRELRANVGPISALAIGLVLTTTLAVAAVAHEAIGLDWPTSFVLGALVSPTDPTAAASIAQRLGLPRRLIAVIEGESLVNDGTALVAYRFAVAAVVTGAFSLEHAAWRFVVNVIGGIAIGLAVGYLIRQLRRRLDNPPVEITVALLSGFFGYLPAQAAGVSGVLAAVTVGIYMGWHTPELTNAQTRLQGQGVWEIVFVLLNGLLFALVGLQLPGIVDRLSGRSWGELVGYAALVSGVVIGARFLWIVATSVLPPGWVRADTAERLRGLYGFRRDRFSSRLDPDGDGSVEDRSQDYQRLRRELLDAERQAVVDLRRSGHIDDDVMRRVVRDLDLEDARLDV